MKKHLRILLKPRLSGIGLALIAACSQAATLVVTSNNDSGAGTLRQAIAGAASGDTITFAAGLNGAAITLTSGQLSITNKNLTIQGPGPQLLALNGNGSSRVLFIENSVGGTRTVSISGLTITNGITTSGGGGIRTAGSSGKNAALTVSNCVIRANQSTTSIYEGGGGVCAARYTTLTMVDCEIVNNSASQIGGGGVWVYETSKFERVSFIGNTSPMPGGGIMIRRSGPASIINCTFSGNAAASGIAAHNVGGGAGIYTQEGGIVYIDSSTISDNTIQGTSAKHQGGGIFSQGTTSMVLRNTLVSGNHGNSYGYDDIAGTFTGVTNCLIQVTNGVSIVGANNIFNQSAQLETLANNGGRTRTHALKKISPAIDKGYNPLNLTTDQRGAGYPRVLGIPAITDIGAYEYLPAPRGTVLSIR